MRKKVDSSPGAAANPVLLPYPRTGERTEAIGNALLSFSSLLLLPAGAAVSACCDNGSHLLFQRGCYATTIDSDKSATDRKRASRRFRDCLGREDWSKIEEDRAGRVGGTRARVE